jgi:hypothetical protein
MYVFDEGDIIVRIYYSGRTAIGMYDKNRTYNKFTYLGKSFIADGGLVRFSNYSVDGTYQYRLATYNEVKILLNELLCYKESNRGHDEFLENNSAKFYYEIVKYYMHNRTTEGMRLNKLKHLNYI